MIDPSNFNFDYLDTIKQPMPDYATPEGKSSWFAPIALLFLGVSAISIGVYLYYENQDKKS